MDDKENLVRQFRQYLDQPPEVSNTEESPDLFSFYSELISLKNEVKIESRQVKNGLDEFCNTVSSVEKSNQTITEHLKKNDNDFVEELEKALMRPVFMGLLDIHDRLMAARQAGRQNKASLFSPFCRKERTIIKAMYEGQEMNLNRIDELLVSLKLRAIETVGQRFNPHTMVAITTDADLDVEDGVVTEELRKGFLWKGEVVRLAEVKVNRNIKKYE